MKSAALQVHWPKWSSPPRSAGPSRPTGYEPRDLEVFIKHEQKGNDNATKRVQGHPASCGKIPGRFNRARQPQPSAVPSSSAGSAERPSGISLISRPAMGSRPSISHRTHPHPRRSACYSHAPIIIRGPRRRCPAAARTHHHHHHHHHQRSEAAVSSSTAPSVPGLNAGLPRKGQEAQRKASPR
jgi:hypothetical protein